MSGGATRGATLGATRPSGRTCTTTTASRQRQRDAPAIFQGQLVCGGLCDNMHMATNLAISPDLLERAVELSGKKTKTATVTLALQEFIARREQHRLLELFDSLDWDPTFDYKAERSRK